MQHDHKGRAEFSRGVAPLALNIGQLGGCFAYSGADWGGDRLVVSGIKVVSQGDNKLRMVLLRSAVGKIRERSPAADVSSFESPTNFISVSR